MDNIRIDARMALARYESSVAAFGKEAHFSIKNVHDVRAYIEQLEAALTHIYAWYPISTFNPHQTIKEIKEFAHKALEGKDD